MRQKKKNKHNILSNIILFYDIFKTDISFHGKISFRLCVFKAKYNNSDLSNG